MTTNRLSRRGFLGVTAGLAAGAGLDGAAALPARPAFNESRNQKATPGDTVRIGIVGLGGRGVHLLEQFMKCANVEIAALCDVYEPHLQRALKLSGGTALTFRDYRRLIELDTLDAVAVATPPHWHPLVAIDAMDAGKDVYCEKPMALTPRESRAMLDAARRNGRVTQIGTQIHAGENYHRVVEVVRSGALGPITCVRTVLSLNEAPDGLGNTPNTDPPANLDWDLWCGPKPLIPYNEQVFVGGHHRYVKELIGSWLHEMGAHILDLPFWALELGPPKAVTAMGGRYATGGVGSIPDTVEVIYEFDGFILTWSNMCANSHGLAFEGEPGVLKALNEDLDLQFSSVRRRLGISFHGVDGTLLADYSKFQVISEDKRMEGFALPEPSLPRSPGHQQAFVDCVVSREQPSCHFGYHYPISLAMNLGNLSLDLGRRLAWDAETETIAGDAEATARLAPTYRAPWHLPV